MIDSVFDMLPKVSNADIMVTHLSNAFAVMVWPFAVMAAAFLLA